MHSVKIRLLHLIKSLDIGGIEKSTILYSNLLELKFDFIGIYSSIGDFDKAKLLNDSVRRFFPSKLISKKLFFFNNLFNLSHVIKKNEISHIHYHHRIYIPFIFFIKIFFPKTEIIYTHHNIFDDRINHLIISNKIIALNEATKHDLPKRLWSKTIIIPHGIPISNTFTRHINSPKNIGYVGRFVKQKGLLKLIKAFKLINAERSDTKLLFIGDGPLKNKMIHEVNVLGLNEKVIFKRPSFNEQKIYADIDLLVLPSEKLEGFGLVILEAMAKGIPVIVSKLNIFKETIIDDFTGIIFKDDLAEKILFYFKNENKLQGIRDNAIKHLQKNYRIETVVNNYINSVYLTKNSHINISSK